MTSPCSARKPPHRVVIRRAKPADLNVVIELENELIRHDRRFDPTLRPGWGASRSGRAFLRERLSGSDGVAFIAWDEATPVGFLVGGLCEAEPYRHTRPMAELECMFVREGHRGRGLGEALVRRFMAWCHQRGVGRLRVVACAGSEGAIAFYRRLGFAPYDLVLERTLAARKKRTARQGPRMAARHGTSDCRHRAPARKTTAHPTH